jgi:hypothetical protein
MEEATAAHRPLEMATASRRQSATTRVLGFDWERGKFRSSQRAQLTQRQSETCTTLDWPDTGRAWGGRLMELGVHAGEWSALPCGSAAPPAERDYPLAKGSNNTHTHHPKYAWTCVLCRPSPELPFHFVWFLGWTAPFLLHGVCVCGGGGGYYLPLHGGSLGG